MPELAFEVENAPRTEEALYAYFVEHGVPERGAALHAGRPARPRRGHAGRPDYERLFVDGLAGAVRGAVEQASGRDPSSSGRANSPARRARAWIVSSYPLLAAMAVRFEIVEDPAVCQRLEIGVAAVSEDAEEIYVNPAAGLSETEARFVIAHELLHVGLRHARPPAGARSAPLERRVLTS